MGSVPVWKDDPRSARLPLSALDSGRRVIRHQAEALAALAETLDERFSTAVGWLLECRGRVVPCGIGKSGAIARKVAGTLSSTGTPSLFLHAAEAVHGDLGMVTSDDVVLLYTHSGETDEIVRLFPSLRAIGARNILITGRADSSAGRQADLVLDTGILQEACPNNLAPTTSTTAMLALSDALAIAAMEARGFGREDFARYHPSGSLGKRLLLTVEDAMRPVAECAVVGVEATVLEAMLAVTKAGVGAACVADRDGTLLGLITEGDFRRHVVSHERPFEALAGAVMTRNVTTVSPELLAYEALESFQNLPKSIGEMPVVADGRLVGLLMLKDLLRSGIV